MKMIRFDEEDIRFLAVELPDLVKHYHYSGDFDGETAEIDRLLKKDLPHALKKRLEIERVIAEGLKRDYNTDFDTLLNRLKDDFPRIQPHTLNALIELGGVDFILRNGQYYFQNSAYANILVTRTDLLKTLDEYGNFHEPSPHIYEGQHTNAAIMKERGGRAFKYTVSMELSVDTEHVKEGKEITVHLPYPAICDEQPMTELLESSHPITVSSSDHRTAAIKTQAKKGEKYFVTFRYVNRARYTELDSEKVSSKQPTFFTDEKLPQIRFTPFLKELAHGICAGESNPLIMAKKIYDYLTDHIHYSYMRDYLYIANIPEFALLNGRGDCGVQAIAFITLCRIMGIPARWQSGCTVDGDGIGSHDWAQIYISPYGWIPVDISYGGGAHRRRDEEMRNYFFGNLSPFRMVTCNDIQVPFDPPKKFMRMDPYDNQVGEAEYSDEGLGFGTLHVMRKLISMEDVTDEYFPIPK